MRKNMKKLISALLAASMLLGSLGAVAFADDATNTADTAAVDTAEPSASPEASAEPTASPEATAEPTATPEPTPAPITDKYYAEAIGLLSVMGIFEGDDNGDFKPDASISRSEMTAVIMRTLGKQTMATYTGVFTDVAANHWAANIIQTAYDAGIINGMGDGTFNPDGNVTYEQAVKMIVCALNYGEYAEAQGGYPSGYILTANLKDIEITKNAKGVNGEAAKRSTIAKMIYNALNADYPTITGYDGSYPRYTTNAGKTLASEMHDIYVREGVMTATALKTIDASVTPSSKQLVVDGTIYTNSLKNAEDLVANYVRMYYRDEDGKGDELEAVYAFAVDSKNKVVELNAKDIEEIKNLQSDERGEVKYEDANGTSKTYRTVASPILVLNGQLFNEANEEMGTQTTEEYLTPEVGTVTLKDFNNDGDYDVVMVEKYRTIVVTSASEKLVAGKFNQTLDVDTSNEDVIVSVTRDGETVRTRNLKKMDIATVLETVNNDGDKVITIDACSKTVTGVIDTDDTDKGRRYITVNKTEYEVDKNAADDISVGVESTLYLDKFGRVAYIESTAGGKLSGNEKYAWLMNLYESEDGENLEIKMFTQDGEAVTAKVAANLRYSGNVGGTYKINETLKTNNADDKKTLKDAVRALDNLKMANGFPIKLIKYTLNANGDVSRIVMPTTNTSIEDAVVVGTDNFNKQPSSSGVIASRYSINDSTIEFTVPQTAADMRSSTSSYAAGAVKVDNYMGREGVDIDFILAEFDGREAGVLIKYVLGSNTASDSKYGTANNTAVGMITGFTTRYDEEEDETVYGIKISTNGNETEYTSKKETTVSKFTGMNDKEIAVEVLWNMNEHAAGISSIRDALAIGDIVGYTTSGTKLNTVVRYIDASEIAPAIKKGEAPEDALAAVKAGELGSEMVNGGNMANRDAFILGIVTDVDIDDLAYVTIKYPFSGKETLVPVDTGKLVDIYDCSTNKTDSDIITSVYAGDIIFVRYHRSAVQEVHVIR